ncbi:MAG: CRISPR-associated protein Csx11, partial [Clostridiales bacterium]|nr:CRISPR-associated protein Csx11 [Clostridiales bacterium]
VTYREDKYAPVIPILAEPLTFMLLVPADKSLQLVGFIKKKYEMEMAKVRDRLPIKLGVVYAGRRMPIRSILDAGRAMLSNTFSLEIWQVKENGLQSKSEETTVSTKKKILLERDKRTFSWCLPMQMGDKMTDDYWYPYLFLASKEKGGSTVTRREAKAVLPLGQGQEKGCMVVHAADLNPGERVYLWPSTFDFEFLDTNARRFELYYNKEGRRPRGTKPFYLEDIDRFAVLWDEYLQHLSRTQCKQLVATIEDIREQWFGQDHEGLSLSDEVFSRFVADVLAGAFWPQEKQWNSIPEHWREELVQAGVRGELTDLLELHLEILKE